MQLHVMNSQGTSLKLFNFPSEGRDFTALANRGRLARSGVGRRYQLASVTERERCEQYHCSWLALCLIFHMSWKNSEQSPAADWSEGSLTLNCGRMWNAGLENGLGWLWEIFRTSILFSCFPHVWGSSESWQNTSGSYTDRRLLSVCLTDVSKQAPAVAAILFVCLLDIGHIIRHL